MYVFTCQVRNLSLLCVPSSKPNNVAADTDADQVDRAVPKPVGGQPVHEGGHELARGGDVGDDGGLLPRAARAPVDEDHVYVQ